MHMLAAVRVTGRLVKNSSNSKRCRIEVRSLQAYRMDADGRQLLRLTSSATRSLSTASAAPRHPSTPTTTSTNTSTASYNSSAASARLSQLNNHIPSASKISSALRYSTTTTDKMSAQAEHPTVLIPGPIEFDDAVCIS